MQFMLLVLVVGLAAPPLARPVENRLSQDPRTTSVEQLDLQILRFAAEHCAFPAPQDTLRIAIHYRIPIRLSDARDQWGQPFVYNEPAIFGDAHFDLYSVGPNGIDESGRGDDIGNWQLRKDIAATWATRDDLTFWSRPYRTQRRILEEELASTNAVYIPTPNEARDLSSDAHSTGTVGSLARNALLLDGPILLAVALAFRRRLQLVVLATAALNTVGIASSIEPGAIYRYTESQVYYLRWSVLEFRASHCRYPSPDDSFATLAEVGLDSLSTLRDARDYWGRPFVLRVPSARDEDLFDLYSVGLNGVDERGGGDDIGVDKAQQVFEEHYAPRPRVSDNGQNAGSSDEALRVERGSPVEQVEDTSGDAALVGRWLGFLDGPFILLGVLWLRRRRARVGRRA